MKYREFRNLLLEYDKKKIQSLQNLLDQRLQNNSDNDRSLPVTDNIIDLANSIEELGVRSGEEIFWLLHRYVSTSQGRYGINRWEDIRARAIPALKQWVDLKKKTTLAPPLPTRDLNQIKTLSDLENILQPYQEKPASSKKTQQKAEEQGFFDRNEAELIYDDAEIKVTSPKTHAASCYFGKNTKWCTTSRDDPETFQSHIQDGPLYIILIKKLNQRYQFHFETDQFMNERDDPIDPRELAEKYPVLWRIFERISLANHSIKLVENPDALPEDQQIDAVDKNPFEIQYIYSPSEPVQLAAVDASRGEALHIIRNQTEAVQWRALHYHGEFLKDIQDPSEEMAIFAIKNTNHPWWVLKSIDNPTDEMLWAALHKDPKSLTHLTHYSEEMALYAIKQDPELISKINNTTAKMRETAIAEQPSVISYHIVPWTLDELAGVVKDHPDYINYVPMYKKQAVLQRINELKS